jgi:methionyl-tRNA formyltransferase
MLKIYDSRKEETSTITLPPPGTLVTDGKKIIRFACSDRYIRVNELQAAGKKRMSAEEFLRGYRGPVAGLNEERT